MLPESDGYMAWAKTHGRARYELTASGLPVADLRDFGADALPLNLVEPGPYGEPDLIDAVGALRGVAPPGVLPVMGTSTANFIALACAASPGQTVLLETPRYDPLSRAARVLGLRVEAFERLPARRYRPDLEAVEQGLRRGARAVVLTNLHNPSGLMCPDDDLAALARLAADRHAYLIVDEVYLDYAVINRAASRVRAVELGEHVIVTDSLTKVYGLGPLRAGWIIADPRVIERARQVLDVLNVVNPVVSARLACRALEHLDRLAERCRRAHQASYPPFAAWLESQHDLGGCGHDGALFSWVRLPEGVRSERLAQVLAADYDTQVVPGMFFGADDHIRIGFGLPPPDLAEGLARLAEAVGRMKPVPGPRSQPD